MSKGNRANPMLAWWIGLCIIMIAVIYVAYRFSVMECEVISGNLEFLVLSVIPAVYLSLMYLTLRGQANSESP